MEKQEIVGYVDELKGFYNSIEDIVDFFFSRKEEVLETFKNDGVEEQLFNDIGIQPKDMDISIEVMDGSKHKWYTQSICSMPIENIIGRQINIGVKENKTGKWLGFTKVSSPIISIKPRNDMFDLKFNGNIVNKHFINGAQIIPVQPFGYNCLGGKLIALISNSHEVREIYNNKYKCDIMMWETTSLYGSIKDISQYDGLKPFIRYNGMTESKNFFYPKKKLWSRILHRLREEYGDWDIWDGHLVEPFDQKRGFNRSNPKLREFKEAIKIMESYLSEDEVKEFKEFQKERMLTLTKKRYYYSNYGYENIEEHLTDGVELIKGQNYHKHNLDYIIEWWKKKAQKRWEKLNKEGRLRSKIEIFNKETITKIDKNDIIR
jgi:hypothetical protein